MTLQGTQETSTISKACSITTWMSFSFDAMCWREFCDLRNDRVTKEYLPQFFPCYPKKTRLSCSETPGGASGQLHLQSIPVNFVECCKCLPMIHWTPPTHEGSFVLHSSLQHVFFSQAMLECGAHHWAPPAGSNFAAWLMTFWLRLLKANYEMNWSNIHFYTVSQTSSRMHTKLF